MRNLFAFLVVILVIIGLFVLVSRKPAAPAAVPKAAAPAEPSSPDAVQQKLLEYSGSAAINCGRTNVKDNPELAKAAAACALQASQSKHSFYVAYDMPGMTVGVAGNSAGKLFSVQSQGTGSAATLSSSDCPSELRVAGSGRVTCFAPGDMGAIGGGHTAIPPGMPNPHEFPKSK